MKEFFKRLFCRHKWKRTIVNDYNAPINGGETVKSIGEMVKCRKCGKTFFRWIKSPSHSAFKHK